jgi:cell division protease FtsH
MNESAILAARSGHRVIDDSDLEEAVDRIVAGPERRTRIIGPREKMITAYHEAGHAISAHALGSIDTVHKVTVIPRGMSGGHTRLIPGGDRQIWTQTQLTDTLAFTLGGMAAEILAFGETSTGPGNDLMQATEIARKMVSEFGMSERIGPISLHPHEGPGILGRDPAERGLSESTAAEIDQEVRRLIGTALKTAKGILEREKDTLDLLAETLIREETVQGSRLQTLLEHGHASEPPIDVAPRPPERVVGPTRPEAAA